MRTSFIAIIAALGLAACSAKPAAEDTPPTEQPPAEQPPPAEPEEPAEPPPAPEKSEQPPPKPEPEPKKPTRYTGRTTVATLVEREQVRCTGSDANATMDQNRAACAQQLVEQVKKPDQLILVIDEQPASGCPTCVSMLAEVSPVANDPPGQVLFVKDTAGTVECRGGDKKLTLEQTRKQCYQTLQKEGASLRASVVLPMGVEEGEPCKSCISIVATGYTATVLP